MAGHDIYCFNPSDMSSHRINPIDRIRRAPEELKAQLAEKLADLVIMNGESTESRGEQTWNRSEKLLLIPLILHAAAGEPQFGHFGALRWLLLLGPDRLAEILKRSPSDVAQMEFEGWMRLSGETDFKYGVFSGLLTKLNPWMTDQMVTLTETTDIDLDEFKNRKFTFYLAVPSRSRDSKLIGSLMVNFLLDHILEIREQMKYPVTMLLDEFTNFGKISGIGDTLSIIRKNKIGLILGFQNYAQLEQVYSRREAQIIIDMPATQVYFKQKTFKEAKELSEAIGRTTIEEASVSDSGRVQEFIQGRALITPDELISLKDEVIVFTADTRPLRLPLTSPTAYEQALAYEAPAREKHMVSEFVRKRGHLARSQEKGWEGNDQQDKELQEKDPPAERDERPSSNNNQNKASQNKTSQNKNSKKSDGRFERQKPTAPEKNYSEKEPEERKTYKKPDRAPGAPDFR
jgi:type IV secretory pathway TraG/TraD family ATPase VirD4